MLARRLLTYVASAWTLVALFNATQWRLIDLSYGKDQPWAHYLPPALMANALWALLTLAIIGLALKLPLRGPHRWRNLGLHTLFGATVAVGHSLLYVALLSVTSGKSLAAATSLLAQKLATTFQINLLIYAVIAAGVFGYQALSDLRRRELEQARLETRLAQAAASALKAQLQPHFLFNALNAISALIRTRPLEAERMLARLGDLLRLSLDGAGDQERSLAEELTFVDAYLAVERYRLGSRLTVRTDLAPGVEAARLPSLILQPLVENAVRHGVAPARRACTLRIRATLADQRLDLSVEDDGVGAETVVEGVGLGNARQRLAHLYGGQAGLTVTCSPGRGFTVRLTAPQPCAS